MVVTTMSTIMPPPTCDKKVTLEISCKQAKRCILRHIWPHHNFDP